MATLNVTQISISGWIILKFGISGLYTTKFVWKKKILKKKICAEGGQNLKKVAIFSKKREKRQKAIFFLKNGQIDPKIGKIGGPQ